MRPSMLEIISVWSGLLGKTTRQTETTYRARGKSLPPPKGAVETISNEDFSGFSILFSNPIMIAYSGVTFQML